MLYPRRNDGLDVPRGILNAILLDLYIGLGLALTVLAWAAIN